MTQQDGTPLTIFDVARESGVSYATVSRVLNNRAYVKPQTREAVLAAMQRLGFVANQQARSLAGGRSRVVGLLASELATGYMGSILRGIDDALAEAEYDLVLYSTRRRKTREAAYVASLTRGMADGLLLVLPRNPEAYLLSLRERGFPYVLVDHQGIGAGDPAVGATNRAGGYAATRHLIELGHRRIGVICGDMALRCAVDRLAGYQDALAEAGIAPDEGLVVDGDFQQPAAYAAAHVLLGLPQPPTAIVAANDVSAFAVIDAASARGLRVPADLSLVGFDDIPAAQMLVPRLTTVRQPLLQMGAAAATMLLKRIEQPELPPERLELPTELIVRASTAAPAPSPPAPTLVEAGSPDPSPSRSGLG
ncbi:MAG: LacI family DNA-binding transcriptional regulator [Roseiflexaceae bacterium]|nr:LacI family DNA-binding transcriptional regulator [Roseiflexaceae bacterium]